MSETKLATKADLKEMYDRMLPYLGGSADAGFTPVGTVISVMSNHAPANYLICDGTVYNISDYPELANHFLNEFGSKNYFGGDGTTTFAVPTKSSSSTDEIYCIATKNIYLNPSNDYSTDEKVVGTWIDGKTLYQKTWILQSFNRTGTNDLGLSSIADSIIPFNAFVKNGLQTTPLVMMNPNGFTYSAGYFISSDKMVELRLGSDFVATEIVITFQYTKTTD